MKKGANSRRDAREAREKLGYILLFEIADPDLELITLTGCEVSVDKSVCRAYISCEQSRYEAVEAALMRAKGRIRSLLGKALGWRVTPDLTFYIDTTTDEAEAIGRALELAPPTIHIEKDEFGYPIDANQVENGNNREEAVDVESHNNGAASK